MAITCLRMLEVGLLLTCIVALTSGYIVVPGQVPINSRVRSPLLGRTYQPSPPQVAIPNLPSVLQPSANYEIVRQGYTPSKSRLALKLSADKQTELALRFIETSILAQRPNRLTGSTLYQTGKFTPSQYRSNNLGALTASLLRQPQGFATNPLTSVQSQAPYGLFDGCQGFNINASPNPFTVPGTIRFNPTIPAGNTLTSVTAQLRNLLPGASQIISG